MPDRPERSKTGTVAINVPASVMASIDQIFDALGLPEPGSILYRVTPDNIADVLDIPTPDDISDQYLGEYDRKYGVDQPTDR